MPDPVLLFATIIALLPMGYLLLAAPAFPLVGLEIQEVPQMLRAMFNGYFPTMIKLDGVGTLACAVAGRLIGVIGFGLIAVFAVSARRWFMQRMDARLQARDAGDAARRLRRLPWGGMLGNALQLAAFIGSVPYIAVTTT
jgi:hypothetical protein